MKRIRFVLMGLVFVAALWLYTATAVPGLVVRGGVESESAELQRAAYRLGIAHSTGYPLHTMIGYAAGQIADWLDQNPYTWITYTSALASATALVLLFYLGLRVSSAPAALAVVMALAVTDTIWHLSTITETQGLHLLAVVGLFVLMVLHLREPEPFGLLAGMAFFAGVGLANHRTIVISIGAAGLSVLLTRRWRRLTLKQWLTLVLVFVLPLLSYSYLFWRVADPHVVFSTRPTWYPAQMTTADVIGVIEGKLQTGQGAEINLEWAWSDFGTRLRYVVDNLRHDLPLWAMVAGGVGLLLAAYCNWRLGVVLAAYSAVWTFFLMSWRLDWKASVYQHVLLLPLAFGLLALAAPPLRRLRSPVVLVLLSLPLYGLAVMLFSENLPQRDLSDDNSGTRYWQAYADMPPNSRVFTGGWSAETFILLEYLDTSGRRDILPVDTLNADEMIAGARNPDRHVFFSPFLRGLYGLYGEATYIPEQGVAFSGTPSGIFIQTRPKHDPRLLDEANGSAFQPGTEIAPEINLRSLEVVREPDVLQLTLYWEAVEPVERSYATYTHLRYYGSECQWDDTVRLLAQADARAPVDGTYPTVLWETGEIVRDTYRMPWPTEPLPDSGVALTVGLTYNGERMMEYCLPLTSLAN